MDPLEHIRNGIANGGINIEDVTNALCDGVKRHYGVPNLHFARRLAPDDSYGILTSLFTGEEVGDLVCWTGANPGGMSPQHLNYSLDQLANGKEKIYFIDLDKWYYTLNDLRHDTLVITLSGI